MQISITLWLWPELWLRHLNDGGDGRVHIWSPMDKGLTAQGWLGSVHHHKDDVLQLKQLLYSVSNVFYWRPVGQLMTIMKRLPFTSDLNYHQEKCILLYIFHLTLKHLVFSTVLTWKIIKKSIDGILNYNCFQFSNIWQDFRIV